MNKTLTINDSASLREILGRRSQGQITLRLNVLTPPEIDYWQHKLNSLYSDCGCSTGAAFMFLSVGLYLTALFFHIGGNLIGMWAKIIIGIIVFFASAGIGKAFGLRRAKRRLEQAVREIIVILASRTKRSHEQRSTRDGLS